MLAHLFLTWSTSSLFRIPLHPLLPRNLVTIISHLLSLICTGFPFVTINFKIATGFSHIDKMVVPTLMRNFFEMVVMLLHVIYLEYNFSVRVILWILFAMLLDCFNFLYHQKSNLISKAVVSNAHNSEDKHADHSSTNQSTLSHYRSDLAQQPYT